MRIKGAMTVLNKRADYFGKTLDWLISRMDDGSYMDQPMRVVEAYEVYKLDQGYYWKGTEGDTWAKITNPYHSNYREMI